MLETLASLRLQYARAEIFHRRRFFRDKVSIDLQRDTWVFVAYQLGDFRYRNAVSDKQGTERMPPSHAALNASPAPSQWPHRGYC